MYQGVKWRKSNGTFRTFDGFISALSGFRFRRHGQPQTAVHGLFHRPEDVLIAGAAAQVPGEELAQLRVRIELAALQNLHRRHDKAGGAETALNGGLVDKGLLDVAELAVGPHQALQCADTLTLCPDSQIDAGVEALAVNDNIAGTAFSHLAALFHAGHVIVVPKHIGQAGPDVHHPFHILAIQVEMDQLILCHYSSPPASFTDSINARLALSTAMCSRKSLAARQESRGLMSAVTA